MSAQPVPGGRFLRKTELAPNEYRKKFKQLDDDVIEALTSPEADRVTPLMSKIYLRLLKAPSGYWERAGVLRLGAEISDKGRKKAWTVLCELAGVSSATLNKSLAWMHQQGIIGYFAGKNGAGIRIFLNRAAASVGTRPASQSKKILPFPPASPGERGASNGETAFKETFGNPDKVSDIDFPAPKNGAITSSQDMVDSRTSPGLSLEQIIQQIGMALEPSILAAAARAAAAEHERTREWLEKRGLPKVARVAQRETFTLLSRPGGAENSGARARAQLLVGKHDHAPCKPRPLNQKELADITDVCVSMLEGHGQAIDVTLAGICSEAGGYLLAEDAPRVRELAELLLQKRNLSE